MCSAISLIIGLNPNFLISPGVMPMWVILYDCRVPIVILITQELRVFSVAGGSRTRWRSTVRFSGKEPRMVVEPLLSVMASCRVVLASKSPRGTEILANMGFVLETRNWARTGVPETIQRKG